MSELLPDLNNISLDHWDQPIFQQHGLLVHVLRLDKIHPDISGNKWFKLKYYLEAAKKADKKKLVSFGGAYSNHLLALAAAASINGFASAAFIRGEEPRDWSQTLQAAVEYGMELRFLPRADYDEKKKLVFLNRAGNTTPDEIIIPEGGAGQEGVRGAEEILSCILTGTYTHIFVAAGTGATLAGIINSAGADQKIIGVSVLKGTHDYEPLHLEWLKNRDDLKNVQVIHDDHFGGYAKGSKALYAFMNRVYIESCIPTDFVYTGKLFYSVERMAALNAFPPGSRILVIHTGGIQGNRSLSPDLLQF
jgi:1-aminocyclopropane-1-carboxylate deaminase